MVHYQAPLRDMQFVRHELFNMDAFYQGSERWSEVSRDLIDAITEESAKFCEQVLVALNPVGDKIGCHFAQGEVSTPSGFKEAYQQYVEAGWPSLEGPVEYGGQGLPKSLAISVSEMVGTANWAWSMYPGLSHGACHTINEHGTEEQKALFLGPLTDGRWTGTMCLTEAHCGTDLGLLRCKAEPAADGSYRISGSKMFISSGEHDLAENIVHIVLARLPDAPAGTKGISLFIVPKFLVGEDGALGQRNSVSCGSIEEKMGIHGNATCVMNFDAAHGFLLGEENRGLNCMFTFMNLARIGTALQGLAHTELAYQNSLAYARERLQMRSPDILLNSDKAADPIIVHPDVRRMLLTQRAFAEGGRMLLYYVSLLSDQLGEERDGKLARRKEKQLGLLTPIAKAFMTETGFEAANLGMQVFGGHGYIREWGMEQNVRDSRIAMLYEGTTGIQALDLLGRKVLLGGGAALRDFIAQIDSFCRQQRDPAMAPLVSALQTHCEQWGALTMELGLKAINNPDEVNAACVDYLMYAGYVCYGFFWAQAASLALQKLADDNRAADSERRFYRDKLYLATFYFQRLLPRTRTLAATIRSGAQNVLDLECDPFAP